MAKKILVVDDDPHLRTLLQVRLSHENYEVLVAPDGITALKLIESTSPDLVIADIMMPEMDGFEFCSRFRARPEHREIPFIFLSARVGVDDRIRGVKTGADDYLIKPFDFHELQARIEALLARYERYQRLTPSLTRGRLSDFPLSDIVQLFGYGRKTGKLGLSRGLERGELYFKEGNVVHGRCGLKEGVNAFYYFLSWEEGDFVFTPELEPPEISIELASEELLLEGTRRLDELSRILDQLPSRDGVVVRTPGRAEPIPQFLEPFLDGTHNITAILASTPEDALKTAQELLSLQHAGLLTWLGEERSATVLVISLDRAQRDQFISLAVKAGGPNSVLSDNLGRIELGDMKINLLGIPGDLHCASLWPTFLGIAQGWLILWEPDTPPDRLKPAVEFFSGSGRPGLLTSLASSVRTIEIAGVRAVAINEPKGIIPILKELTTRA